MIKLKKWGPNSKNKILDIWMFTLGNQQRISTHMIKSKSLVGSSIWRTGLD